MYIVNRNTQSVVYENLQMQISEQQKQIEMEKDKLNKQIQQFKVQQATFEQVHKYIHIFIILIYIRCFMSVYVFCYTVCINSLCVL